MMDYTIPKPERTSGYALHRMVAALADGKPALFADNGDHIVVRTDQSIAGAGRAINPPSAGAVVGFELKASVASRHGGRNVYPALHDWRTRREWLEAQGQKHGFEVLAVHVNSERQQVSVNGGRRFWIDASRFTGVLKVTDPAKFALALTTGIGRVGKAFGMGMLVI